MRVSINGVSGESVTGGDGKWQCKIPPLQAGGPFVLKIESRGKTLDIDDIYVGEVSYTNWPSTHPGVPVPKYLRSLQKLEKVSMCILLKLVAL